MPAITKHADWSKALAAELTLTRAAPPAQLNREQALSLSWALKDAALAAWSGTPAIVGVAAAAIESLRASQGNVLDDAEFHVEMRALDQWVGGIAQLTRGKMSNALEHFDRAANLFTSLSQPNYAAQAQVPKVMALAILGRTEEAYAVGNEVRDTLMHLGDANAAAKVSLNLGNLCCQSGRYANAVENFSVAKIIFLAANEYGLATSCEIGLAEAYCASGDLGRAQASYVEVIQRAARHELHANFAIATEANALLDLAKGDYATALKRLNEALRHYVRLDMPQYVAMTEKQLGDIYAELRLWPEALALYDKSIPRLEALEMPVEVAWTYVHRARALASLAYSSQEIDSSLKHALHYFDDQQFDVGKAAVRLAQAELALQIGEVESAIEHADAAKNMFSEAFLVIDCANTDVVVGHALLAQKRFDDAQDLFSTTLQLGRDLNLLSIEVRSMIGIGLAHLGANDGLRARQAFETATELFELQRQTLPGDDLRIAFMADHWLPYQELLRLDLENGAGLKMREHALLVIKRLEVFRARTLSERLREPVRADRENASDDLAPEIVDRRSHLDWLYRRARALALEGEDASSIREESRRMERELLEATRRIRATNTGRAHIADRVAPVDLDVVALTNALTANDVMIEYGVLDDELFACVVTSSRLTVVRQLSRWSAVLVAIERSRFQIETMRYGARMIEKHQAVLLKTNQTAQNDLYELVWAPLEQYLANCDRVLVVPHGRLGVVQFAALFDGSAYLAQRYSIAIAPSAQIAHLGLDIAPDAPASIIALGESSGLAHAAAEAEFVASLFPTSCVLTGSDANKRSLVEAIAGADVVHLACHGLFRADNPTFSALELVDAPFTASDAERLSLKRSIITLSACESGLAQYVRGDEMFGLVRGFMLGGASRVIASLWPVDDAITQTFMKSFYISLQNRVTPAVALQKAQLDTMSRHPHPFHWAAFALYGGW